MCAVLTHTAPLACVVTHLLCVRSQKSDIHSLLVTLWGQLRAQQAPDYLGAADLSLTVVCRHCSSQLLRRGETHPATLSCRAVLHAISSTGSRCVLLQPTSGSCNSRQCVRCACVAVCVFVCSFGKHQGGQPAQAARLIAGCMYVRVYVCRECVHVCVCVCIRGLFTVVSTGQHGAALVKGTESCCCGVCLHVP